MNDEPARATSTTPLAIAIVVAGGMIGLGLYLGLRSAGDRPELGSALAASNAPAVAPPSVETALVEAAPVAPLEVASASSSAHRSRDVALEATAALDRQRKAIVAACVLPALAQQPEPPTVKLTFNFTFGEDGKQLGRGVAEDRATSRPEVTRCVVDRLNPISVSPPGQRFRVDVPWTLP